MNTKIEFVVDPDRAEKGKPRAIGINSDPIANLCGVKRIKVICHDETDCAVARDTIAEMVEGA